MNAIPQYIVAAIVLSTANADQAKLDKAQVTEMAKIILKSSNNDLKFRFSLEDPRYSEKDGLWSFSAFQTSGGVWFLQIRDSDLYFRVGWIGEIGQRPKRSYEFRLPPNIKRKFKEIVDEHPK